jgi:hypothetical protein
MNTRWLIVVMVVLSLLSFGTACWAADAAVGTTGSTTGWAMILSSLGGVLAVVITNVLQNSKVKTTVEGLASKIQPITELQTRLIHLQTEILTSIKDNQISVEEAKEIYNDLMNTVDAAKAVFGGNKSPNPDATPPAPGE